MATTEKMLSTLNEKTQNHHYKQLWQKIQSKEAKIGILGLGYVGLPNAVAKAENGYSVIGFDLDEIKVEKVNRGISYINDVTQEELQKVVQHRYLQATDDFSQLKEVDVVHICVPTPIDKYKQPDLTYVENSSLSIASHVSKGTLVILESTTYPATTREYVVNALEEKGFLVGEDIFVAYSPERIDPANASFNVKNTPRIVGGVTEKCTQLALEVLGGEVRAVSSPEVAEMSKVFENTFRYVNIALANELALVCERMGIDVWEVINAAATKPYGFMPFYPTAGVGGHCIPVDPHYLSFKSKEYGFNTRMIDLANEVNGSMIHYTVRRILEILNNENKFLKDSNIVILGAAYKKNIGDARESAVYMLYEELSTLAANVSIQDNHVEVIKINDRIVEVENVNYEKIKEGDLVIILTDHDDVDYERVEKNAQIIFDTKNVYQSKKNSPTYYKL
ncbi:nucleotide sugar dehydrogenase [Priestia endophytica]|uniref:nucleotide sugar dehydrogenase n=1 Tax=Priestia endophytica TaxID=135735 RepID=UPI0018CE0667|nr:nucleotide sugar dehydrogenase [Priestia endophytica]